MTKVKLERVGNTYAVVCKDHAKGSPETCAAVSCLMYTLCGWLKNTDKASIVFERIEEANAAVLFRGGKEAETAFDVICAGFLQLELSFKDYIKVKTKNI